MTSYVALLRGIGPGNPNMTGEKLRGAFETMGFKNVATVIASGNVVFSSGSSDSAALETKIEKALPKLLGFSRSAIVRSQKELESLVKKDPFKGKKHSRDSYLLVTFLKDRKRVPGGALYNALSPSKIGTPECMQQLEREYGKEITSRTWDTIHRILKKMQSAKG